MTSSLGDSKKNPNKMTLSVEDRIEVHLFNSGVAILTSFSADCQYKSCGLGYLFQDPFGDVIKKIMNAIHTHAELSTNCDLGSQRYEQWVVVTEREGA